VFVARKVLLLRGAVEEMPSAQPKFSSRRLLSWNAWVFVMQQAQATDGNRLSRCWQKEDRSSEENWQQRLD